MSMRSGLVIAIACAAISFHSTDTIGQPVFLKVTDPVPLGLNPAFILPTHTFRWTTAEGSPDPAEIRHALVKVASSDQENYEPTVQYLRATPNAPEWSPWEPYVPSAQGMAWTTSPLQVGNYVFAVQGRDSDGNVESLDNFRNIIRTKYRMLNTGPWLTVTGDLISPINTIVTTTAPTQVTVASQTTLTFCWTATAAAYGALIAGYRYQWDITNPDDESQWQMPLTPLPAQGACSVPIAFASGTHRIVIEAVDSIHGKSRVPIDVNVSAVPVAPSTWGSVKALYR